MGPEMGRTDALSPAVPTWLLGIAAVAIIALWIASHFMSSRLKSGSKHMPWIIMGVRAIIGAIAIWTALQIAARFLILATNWSLWSAAFLASASIEIVVWLYELERQTLARKTSIRLLALRLAAVVLVILVLIQPVLARFTKRGVERTVAILMDDSGSMHLEDQQLTVAEKISVAELFGAEAAAGRYKLTSVSRDMTEIARKLSSEQNTLKARSGNTPDQARSAIAERKKDISDLVQLAKATLSRDLDHVDAAWKDKDRFDHSSRTLLEHIRNGVRDDLPRKLSALDDLVAKVGGVDDANLNVTVQNQMHSLVDDLGETLKKIPTVAATADDLFYKSLSETDRKQIDTSSLKTRATVLREVLVANRKGRNIIEHLQNKYSVKLSKFAARTSDLDPKAWLAEGAAAKGEKQNSDDESTKNRSFRQKTDLSAALESISRDVEPENLAGVMFLTDGLHNGLGGVEAIARKLGAQGTPIATILVGGTLPPKDASVLMVNVPESIFLGDLVSIKVDLKFDGLRGQRAKIKLLHNGSVVSEKTADVPEDSFRTSVRFTHTPPDQGIFAYSVEIEAIQGEVFKNNNKWDFDVAVSNDRTNVLLVEDRPRWEYRYLRNLFFGRDKSVHLQYVLLTPDKVTELPSIPPIAASAARKFGDAEATMLPATREEWMKFDVIILGDIPPSALDDKTIDIIQDCVSERGAMLIVIAGQRYMPHAYSSSALKEMLPVQYKSSSDFQFSSPESSFKLQLTPDGREHSVMQLSASPSESEHAWESLPAFYWRHASTSTKEGATVLAYAEPTKKKDEPRPAAATEEEALNEAARGLADEMAMRKQNALVVAHKYSQGRVLMLTFDSMWRLRYRVGDTYHHKFWGQALRWGAPENLRAGNDCVRLGTDKVTYTPDDSIHVIAKVNTVDYKPVNNDRVFVNVFSGDKLVLRKALDYRDDSNGIYETMLKPLSAPGKYRVELHGGKVQEILAQTKTDKVQTDLMVSAESPMELSELAASHTVPSKMAGLSSGAVLSIDDAERVLTMFGAGSQMVKERQDTTLWDSWTLLLLILACVGTEWIIRKQGGLP